MFKKILVIEDETQTRNIFLRCLKFEGFHAIGAENGVNGIKLAQAHPLDLIVCDIMMPDMDGYHVLAEVRQQPTTATIPFIFLTAKVTMPDLRRGMDLGADDYLTKPCTVEQFLGAIATRLKRRDDLKRLYSTNPSPDQSSIPPAAEPPSPEIFPDCPKLAKVFCFIDANYHQPINLSDVAQVAGYSPAYLTNLVQSHTGRTIKQWIIERRMAQARSLLMGTANSVRQIAEEAGYTDVGYFVRQFRQVHGMPPQVWRRVAIAQTAD
jgi:YesN/AraC family two-component response regulator